MSHDVFISYSSKDKNVADAVCAVLERNGIRCWIAPRDVTPGMVWSSAIVGAIHGATVVVLVFSGAANTSPQIEREVERAISKSIPIIPFRIEEVRPTNSLEYFISASHWLDAFTEPLEQHLEMLAKVVRRILEVKLGEQGGAETPTRPVAFATPRNETPTQPIAASSAQTAAPLPPRPSRLPVVVASTAALAACLALVALFLMWESKTTAVTVSHQEGEVFRDCAECPQMVVVPAGHFMMGAADQEKSSADWERTGEQPVHDVRFAKPFAVGIYAVTRDDFAKFARETKTAMDGGCYYWTDKETLDPTRSFLDPKLSGGPQAGDHPVVCVSPQEAAKYAAWLSDKTGHNYRLLSDAEREYVTRAGTTTAFWWGPNISPDQANYWSDASYRGSATAPGRWTTLPVKFFKPNPWGLFQVHGNVTELVADCWHPNYVGAPSDGSVWQANAGGDCKERTIRSGSFMNSPDLLRSAHRRSVPADLREVSIGFRLAQTLAN
jgi:formylglycine-generating enzyme required for sulfatase activity